MEEPGLESTSCSFELPSSEESMIQWLPMVYYGELKLGQVTRRLKSPLVYMFEFSSRGHRIDADRGLKEGTYHWPKTAHRLRPHDVPYDHYLKRG